MLRVVPIQGSSSSSADVLVDSSDMVQTSVPISTSVGIQPASSGTVGSLSFNQSKAKDFEKCLSTVVAAELEVQQRAANCKTANLESKPTVPTDLEVIKLATVGDQLSQSLQRVRSSQYDLILSLLDANALNRCIVVIISSSNIHGTRRPGMDCVFGSPLHDQVILELMCSLLEACLVFALVALSRRKESKYSGDARRVKSGFATW